MSIAMVSLLLTLAQIVPNLHQRVTPCPVLGVLNDGPARYCVLNNPDPMSHARFGHACEVLDFNGDGHLDLAVGAPGNEAHDVGGRVYLFFGPSLAHYVTIVPSSAQLGDLYGDQLASGDLDQDGTDELVIGAPSWDAGPGRKNVGYVAVWAYAGGAIREQYILTRSDEAIGAQMGSTVAVGDVVEGPELEVIVGAPFAPHTTKPFLSGAVSVFTFPTGFPPRETIWDNPHPTADHNEFGNRVAVADWDGDGQDDLFVAAIFNDTHASTPCLPPCVEHGGQVFVFPHQLAGAGTSPHVAATIDNPRAGGEGTGTTCASERFGMHLDVRDLNGDGFAELAVGAPRDDHGRICEAGRAYLFSGRLWSAATPNAAAVERPNPMYEDLLGYRVLLSDMIGDDQLDLIACSPSVNRPDAMLVWDGARVLSLSGMNPAPGLPDLEVTPLIGSGSHYCGSISAANLDGVGRDEVILGDFDYCHPLPGTLDQVGRVVITFWP